LLIVQVPGFSDDEDLSFVQTLVPGESDAAPIVYVAVENPLGGDEMYLRVDAETATRYEY
jgi:hypothetical protein